MTDADVTRQLRRLDALAHGLRRRHRIALGGALIGALATAPVLLAWLPAGWRSGPGSPLPLVTWLVLACLLLLLARRAGAGGGEGDGSPLVREAERSVGLRSGELQGARELGDAAGSGSAALADRHRHRVADALAPRADADLLPVRLPAARAAARRGVGLGLLALLLLGGTAIIRPEEARGAVEALARPWRVAFPPRPPRLRLEGEATVLRGAPLALRVHAPGRPVITLAWAEEGEPVRRAGVAVDAGSGRAEGWTGPIDAPVRVWAEERGGRSSDTLRVTPVDPLLVARLDLVVEPPAWTGLAPDTLSGTGSPVLVQAGATIRVSGEATHGLASGSLVREAEAGDGGFGAEATPLAVEGERFSATLRPDRGGSWRFQLQAAGPVPGVRPPPPLVIRVLEDRPPVVRVLRPGRDLEAGVGPELRILVDATDDEGVVRLDLVTWRSSAGGLRTEPERRALAAGPAEARRVVPATIRIAEMRLAPGDTLHYRAEARDANPANPTGRSRAWRIWVPALADLERAATERVDALADAAAAVAAEASALSREAREAERLAAGGSTSASRREAGAGPDYRSTETARAVRDRGLTVERRLDDLEEELSRLEEGLDGSPAAQASLRHRLGEIAALVRELRESGLGDRLRALEEAIDGLDGEATREALARLADGAADLERRIDETAELMERAAAEQAARDVSARAGELADRQERIAGEPPDDGDWAAEEERLARATEDLARRMEELSGRLEAAGAETQAAAFAGSAEEAATAAERMREAAREARATDGERAVAARRAEEASSSLREAARESEEAARALSRDWREEAVDALDAATGQSLDLAAEQARITAALESGRGSEDVAGRQAAVRAGLDRVTQALSQASRRSALVDSRVGPAADRARREMQDLERRLAGEGTAPGGAALSRDLTEGLNDLAVRLRVSRRAMEGAATGTGLEEALEQLARLGRAQADVNRESGGLLLPSLRGEAGAERLARLAGRQAEIARELERMAEAPGGDELAARPGLLAAEADEIAGSIRSSGLDRETVARQERLFRRLLEAGRTLERDPDPNRRASRTAATPASSRPAPPPMEAAGPRYPYPADGRLREMPPEVRRLVLDYFDRLNRSTEGER